MNTESIRTHRLTKKEVEECATSVVVSNIGRVCGKTITKQIMFELFEYKSIEEKLGIDLVTLFKALKHGIFAKDIIIYHLSGEVSENQRLDPKYLRINLWDECLEWDNIWNPKDGIHQYEFLDYGKTWALTKEELQ